MSEPKRDKECASSECCTSSERPTAAVFLFSCVNRSFFQSKSMHIKESLACWTRCKWTLRRCDCGSSAGCAPGRCPQSFQKSRESVLATCTLFTMVSLLRFWAYVKCKPLLHIYNVLGVGTLEIAILTHVSFMQKIICNAETVALSWCFFTLQFFWLFSWLVIF